MASAQRIADEASADGIASPSILTALQQAYVRNGDYHRAAAVFRHSWERRLLDTKSYVTMLAAYVNANRLRDAERVLRIADRTSCLNEKMCLLLMRAYATTNQADKARRIYERGERRGVASALMRRVLC